jgi:hypothetical protein
MPPALCAGRVHDYISADFLDLTSTPMKRTATGSTAECPGVNWRAFTILCLVLAAALRFAWIGDVEYKADERGLFEQGQSIRRTQLWPTLGSPGAQLRHPALGVWTFAFLVQAFDLDSPLSLTRAVQTLSFAAVTLLFIFAWRLPPGRQREIWLWTTAFASVNLFAVIHGRKIWQPDLLPIFSVAFLFAWWHRRRRAGSLGWGLGGALIGQIHMSGFFAAAAWLIGTLAFARQTVRWRAWLAGSACGVVPLLPWLDYMWSPGPRETGPARIDALFQFDFFRGAFGNAIGDSAEHSLGSGFSAYLRYPVVWGVETHAVWAVRIVLAALGIGAAIIGVWGVCQALRAVNGRARRWADDSTALALVNMLVMALLISFSRLQLFPHYHAVVYPFEFLWLAAALVTFAPTPRLWLAAVWTGLTLCTASYLQYVHHHCGAPGGDYGVAYRCQESNHGEPGEWYPDQPIITPGREDVVAEMLGTGEAIADRCRFTDGHIGPTMIRAVYRCGANDVILELRHPSKMTADGIRTDRFAISVASGSPPLDLLPSLTSRIRAREARFEWRWPGTALLPLRTILLGMLAVVVLLLVSAPWWAATARPSRADVPSS